MLDSRGSLLKRCCDAIQIYSFDDVIGYLVLIFMPETHNSRAICHLRVARSSFVCCLARSVSGRIHTSAVRGQQHNMLDQGGQLAIDIVMDALKGGLAVNPRIL